MPFDGAVVHAASEQLKQNAQRHRDQFDRRRQEIYQRIPQCRTIDRLLSQTVRTAAQSALQQGVDPTQVINLAKQQNLALQQQRKELLLSYHYSEDALTYQPLCPICRDAGWRGSEMCHCLRDLCGREQVKRLSSMLNLGDQSFDTFDLDYYSPQYDSMIGDSPRTCMESIQAICFQFADRFGRSPGTNLFLSGKPGLGKTFLSAAIARVVSEKGYSVVYDSAVNVFLRFDAQRFGRDPSASADVERYMTCDLMILDDLGSEMLSPSVHASLYQLVNTRLISGRQTVISSNLSLDEIKNRYSEQIHSRLSGDYLNLRFYGTDIRQLKRMRGRY